MTRVVEPTVVADEPPAEDIDGQSALKGRLRQAAQFAAGLDCEGFFDAFE